MTGQLRLGPDPAMTVGDLTDEHRGWIVKVAVIDHLTPYRTFRLNASRRVSPVRRWSHNGVEWIGLLDDNRGPGFIGTEHRFPATTSCELIREVKRGRHV